MTEYEIKPAEKLSLNTKELWDFKELFYFFTWKDIKIKYKQTVLGFLWAILQPTLMMIIFSFVFGRIIPEQAPIGIPYPVFVYTGLILWTVFSTGLQNAGNSMVNNANIIKKIYFPRLIIPMSTILATLFDFLITLVLYLGLVLYYQADISWLRFFTFFPLALTITVFTTFGLGTFLSALNVKYRDFRYVIPFLIQFLMFATPVIYPVTIVDNKVLQFLLNLNPLSTAINLARSVIEPSPVDWNQILLSIFISIVSVIVGMIYFRKTESYFADLA